MDPWTEIMPAIPLERSVPIIWTDPDTGIKYRMVVESELNPTTVNAWHIYGNTDNDTPVCIRSANTQVDLDERQGVAYALRKLRELRGPAKWHDNGMPWNLQTWLSGGLNITQKADLAQAWATSP